MRFCSIEGCENKHEAKGYCKKHYKKHKKYGDPLYTAPIKMKEKKKKDNKKPTKTYIYEEHLKLKDGIQYKKCSNCDCWKPMNRKYYYFNNSSKIIPYHSCCIECLIEKSVKYKRENIEKVKEYNRRYNATPYSKNAVKIANMRYRETGKNKLWQQRNKDKLKEYRDNRKIHKSHNINKNEWENCKNYFSYRCAYCGLAIEDHYIVFKGNVQIGDFHKDHFIHEGSNDLSNCVPACKSCNCSKHDKQFEEWFSNDNSIFNVNRYNKIVKWISGDYRKYLESK